MAKMSVKKISGDEKKSLGIYTWSNWSKFTLYQEIHKSSEILDL